MACSEGCDDCTAPGLVDGCIKCKMPLQQEGDTCSCKPGTYFNVPQMECTQCHPSCKTCNNGTIDDCLNCRDKFMSLSKVDSASHGKCICIRGRFDEEKSNDQSVYDYQKKTRCKSCSIGCSHCDGIGLDGVCFECNGDLQHKHKTCFCADGKTLNVAQGSCNNCWVTCSKCQGTGPDKCTACKDEKMVVILARVNRNRLLTTEMTGHCKCKLGSFDLENITPNQFTDYVTENSRCEKCSHGCSSCTNSGLSDVCNTCEEPLIHK
jgi:hypothetical protein